MPFVVLTGKLYLLHYVTTMFTDRSPHLNYITQIIKQWLHERLGVTSHLSTKACQEWDILHTVILHLITNHDLVAFIETNVTAIIRWYMWGVPLATKPGISSIIVPLMRILQQNVKWAYLIVWEMWQKRTYSCSNFVAISSLVLELLKKCWVQYQVGHPVFALWNTIMQILVLILVH